MAITQTATGGIKDDAVTLDKFTHGDSNNNGKFLRANNGAAPSFETISIPASTTINNNADNKVITGSGSANTLEAETNLTYNGATLSISKSDSNTLDGIILQNSDTTNNGLTIGISSTENAFLYNGSNTDFQFGTNNTEAFTLKNNGDASIINGNLIVANGHGIDFSATANAIPGQFNPARTPNPTTDSELFHDYEYGTWNPVVWTSNGATNATINTIGGHYVKVGRLVYLTFFCDWSGATNHGNYIYFNGFPFLSAANSGQDYNYGIGSCQINGFSFGNGGPQLHQGEASTGCNLVSNVSGGNSQNDGPTNTGMVIGNISYVASY